jgi:hypothetical protein
MVRHAQLDDPPVASDVSEVALAFAEVGREPLPKALPARIERDTRDDSGRSVMSAITDV